MADMYVGEITGVQMRGRELEVSCILKKDSLHRHNAVILFNDDPREKDAFLSRYLKVKGMIRVTFG